MLTGRWQGGGILEEQTEKEREEGIEEGSEGGMEEEGGIRRRSKE